MNKRKLQHFKLAILLFGICVLFTNCQKENIEVTTESQLDPRVKHITFAAFKSKTASSENYQKLNSFFDFNKTQVLSEYNRLESSDGAWIMTDEIVMIEREDKLFYTFKIGTVTSSDSFYNLLVITDVTGEIIDSKIFEYIPSSAWLEDTSQPFTGYMKLNDDDIFSISDLNGMLSRGGQLCITGTRDNWICSKGNNHDGPAPGRTCTWWENTITAIYGQCPPVLTPGELDEGVPVGPGSSGGGGGGPGASTGTTNNDCVPAIDNPCDEDETFILPPREVVNLTHKKNCLELQINSRDDTYLQRMQTLKTEITGSVEKGFGIYNGAYNNPPLPNPSCSSIISGTAQESPEIGFLPIMKAVVHNHLIDPLQKHIGIFTPRDIIQLANIVSLLQNNSSSVQEHELAAYLVCGEGNYVVKISDNSKLYDFAIKYGTDNVFKKKVDRFYKRNNMVHGKPKQLQNIGFLNLLKKFDIGITLYESDENYENWEQLSLNEFGDNITKNPC